jgi:hypothetical protein
MKVAAVKAAVLDNPYIPLCTPPVLIVLQFLLALALFHDGLPDYDVRSKLSSILLTFAFFGLWGISIPALLLGVRNLIYGPNKLAPALGVALNFAYLVVFAAGFILLIVSKATN